MLLWLSLTLCYCFLLYRLHQVCSSVFNSWDQFKDHLVSHTGDKPNHCTMCDMWFTHPKELKTHLRDVHSIEDSQSPEELVVTDPAATDALAIATQSIDGTETVLLDDGIQVEHVTVEPVDMMEMEETATVVVEDEGVTEMCEEDMERLKQAGVQIQVVHVTTTEVDGQQVVNSQVEVEMEAEMVNVEEVEQAVDVWEWENDSKDSSRMAALSCSWRLSFHTEHCMQDPARHSDMFCSPQSCWMTLLLATSLFELLEMSNFLLIKLYLCSSCWPSCPILSKTLHCFINLFSCVFIFFFLSLSQLRFIFWITCQENLTMNEMFLLQLMKQLLPGADAHQC